MHIFIEGIYLKGLQFEVNPNYPELDYNLHVACESHFESENELVQVFDFDIMHGLKEPPFLLKFRLSAKFVSEGEGDPSLDEFAKTNGPANVVPYARELISNITSRTDIPTLVIPPVNIFRLIEEGQLEHTEQTMKIEDFIDPPVEDENKSVLSDESAEVE